MSVSLIRAYPTPVLFWIPGCGFCQRMLRDLKAWERGPPAGATKLVVVSTGNREQNKLLSLESPVVLDPALTAGTALGASGTPSAGLVDAKDDVTSKIVAGDRAILALAGTGSGRPGSP